LFCAYGGAGFFFTRSSLSCLGFLRFWFSFFCFFRYPISLPSPFCKLPTGLFVVVPLFLFEFRPVWDFTLFGLFPSVAQSSKISPCTPPSFSPRIFLRPSLTVRFLDCFQQVCVFSQLQTSIFFLLISWGHLFRWSRIFFFLRSRGIWLLSPPSFGPCSGFFFFFPRVRLRATS